jgi:hypothetical protein
MRLIIFAAFAGLLSTVAHADSFAHCDATWKAASAADKATTTYRAFTARCLKKGGTGMMTPVAVAPRGATARCNDGTFSTSHTPSDQCSDHGGIATSL